MVPPLIKRLADPLSSGWLSRWISLQRPSRQTTVPISATFYLMGSRQCGCQTWATLRGGVSARDGR